jgi:hypothetical protein
MGLTTYVKTIVQDNTDKVVASHHNNQENQLAVLTDNALATQALIVQNAMFGTVGAGAAAEKAVFVAPTACRVYGMSLVNGASVASNGINYTKLELVNKGATGSGTTVLTTFDGSADSFTTFDASSETFSADLSAGDVLTLKKTDFGAGAAVSELLCSVSYKPIP